MSWAVAPVPIRSWLARDAAAVDELLTENVGHDPPARAAFSIHGPEQDAPGARSRTLIAEAQGRVVGVGTAWEYWLHPTRWRVAIHVRSRHRRRGIGSALFAALVVSASRVERRPWQVAARADDEPGLRFLGSLGFAPLMRTHLGPVNPASIAPRLRREAAAAATRVEAAGYRMAPLAGASDPDQMRRLAALHLDIYRRGHQWSPLGPVSPAAASRLFLDAADVIPSALDVAWAGQTPAAVASLRRSPPVSPDIPTRLVDLGWVGTAAAFAPDAPELVPALLDRCLRQAEVEGWTVRVEIDEADRLLWGLGRPAPGPLGARLAHLRPRARRRTRPDPYSPWPGVGAESGGSLLLSRAAARSSCQEEHWRGGREEGRPPGPE